MTTSIEKFTCVIITKAITSKLILSSYDKDKQKVVPPGAFSDPATWKVIPPGEFRLQCARPVGLMWRDHWE